MKLTYIEWQDAISPTQAWRTLDEILEWDKGNSYVVKQVGWILKEDKHAIIMSSQMNDERTLNGDLESQYAHVIRIPKTWIIKRKELKV